MTEVVVTGLGVVSPLGLDTRSTWDGLCAGRSSARRLTEEWAKELPVRIAATVPQEFAPSIDPVTARRLDRTQQFALAAAREAWQDAGLSNEAVDPERLAVVIGTGIGGVTTLLTQHEQLLTHGVRSVSPLSVPMFMPNGPAAWVGLEFGALAGIHAPTSACATGSEAIANGMDLIRSGRANVVLAGGTEAAVCASGITVFARMRALSRRNDEPARASRPFDKDRDGFVMGEGAGVVVLEREDHAQARGVRIHARLAGAGITSDSFHIVQPDPAGTGAARAISVALADARISRREVVHVNAHATATPAGDTAEAHAIRRAIGDHALITAPKAALGHLLGGAGAVEAIATILTVSHGIVPPTCNLDNLGNDIDLDIVTIAARRLEIPVAVSNSFGFGGHNVVLVFSKVA